MDQRANRCGFQVEDQCGHCLGAHMSCLCSGNCFRRELPAGVVDGVGRIEDQLTDGHNGIPVVDQAVEDGRQGLRRVQRSVVEQHDAAGLDLGGHTLADGVRVVVLPIQRVPIGNDLKPLRRKGLQVLPLCASSKKLTCKWGVWRVVQARERSKSRGCAQGREVVERWGWMRYTIKQSKNLLHQTKGKCYRLGNCIVLVWMV